MATTFKAVYPANNQALTFSGLNSLANGSTVWSSAIDNTSNLDLDALVCVSLTTAAASVSSTGTYSVLIAASSDGGTTYNTNTSNAKLLGVVTANANSTVYILDPSSIAAMYGGQLPPFFKIGITNNTGQALASSGNSGFYVRIQTQGV